MNILVLYYTQSGQIEDILKSMFSKTDKNITIDYTRIHADPEYPFPWPSDKFFDVFPESKEGVNCNLKPFEIKDHNKYDLIVLGLQVWYLEPSVPIASLLRSKYSYIFENKPIVTVYGIRNMWINAHKEMKKLIKNAKGKLVGNIVLSDRHNNLISVLTIVRWLFRGKKEASKFLPVAGVSDTEIKSASKFGIRIQKSLINNDLFNLQSCLENIGAVKVDYHIMKTEFAGSRIFGIWSSIILKRSSGNLKKRKRLLTLFKYYLFFVIYVISPLSSFIFKLIRLVFPKKTQNQIIKHISII